MGDFNLTREPSDRSNDNFDATGAHLFNDFIHEAQLRSWIASIHGLTTSCLPP